MRKPSLDLAQTQWNRWKADRQLRRQLATVEAYLSSRAAGIDTTHRPVLFFNASTRIHHLSQNAAFSLLVSWSLRHAGVPAYYLACQRGMTQCMLGTNRTDHTQPPPCTACTRLSEILYPSNLTLPLNFQPAPSTAESAAFEEQPISALKDWMYAGLPIGNLCTPSLQWALRRQTLSDDKPTRHFLNQYLSSAASLANQFQQIFTRLDPQALVVFNGITYPEAIARAVATKFGIPVITHEVGLQPNSAFFSHVQATIRHIDLPENFKLGEMENQRLNQYLEARFKGQFTMAGVQFWPEMVSLPDWLKEKIAQHRQMAVVFTNVIFDTSQVHANTIFADMFSWLESIKQTAANHLDTLFVIRAHPDEDRPGKASLETVSDWVERNDLLAQPNVVFFKPSDYISSYELIQQAKVTLVYNSSIGLEASIRGAAVLCAGRARYTQLPTVFFPQDRAGYAAQLEEMLSTTQISVPEMYGKNARIFLYFELYHASLDLSEFMEPYPASPGNVTLSEFDVTRLEDSPQLALLKEGILKGTPFVMP